MESRDDEFKISLFLNHFYNLKNPEAPLMYCFWCLSFCAGRRLSRHNSTEAVVNIGGCCSDSVDITSSVPHDSVLDPTFLLFIDDMMRFSVVQVCI